MIGAGFLDLNVEFGHLYQHDIEQGKFDVLVPNLEVTRQCVEILERQGLTYTKTILVDDYSYSSSSRDVAPLLEFLKQEGLEPHYVAFESDLVSVAPMFLEGMKKRYVKEHSGGTLVYLQSEDSHLPESVPGVRPKARLFDDEESTSYALFAQRRVRSDTQVFLVSRKEESVRYSCPLLAACWVLARLGKQPFAGAIRPVASLEGRPFFGRQLINILPTEYLKVESTVLDLLGQLRDKELRTCQGRIRYWFHPQ